MRGSVGGGSPAGGHRVATVAGWLGRAARITCVQHGPTNQAAVATSVLSVLGLPAPSPPLPLRRLRHPWGTLKRDEEDDEDHLSRCSPGAPEPRSLGVFNRYVFRDLGPPEESYT